MKTDEILAWFEVMGIVPTTAEYIKASEVFSDSICLDPDFPRIQYFRSTGQARDDEARRGNDEKERDPSVLGRMTSPLERAAQFRNFSGAFYKYLKWWHWLRFVPGVRGVALNNKAAFMAPNNDSDIDIFIVAKKNTVWLTRGLVTLLAILLKARRTDKNFAGKWCLPFFLEENVPVQSLALETTDPELLWWENNLLWLVGSVGHPHLCQKAFTWRLYSVIAKPFNHLAYIWQKKIFLRYNEMRSERRELKIEMSEGVVLTLQVAKFHTIDRRREHAEAWKKLCLNS